MADDKSKTNNPDRKRVAAHQGYEVSYFARKHGLSLKDARTVIERFGNDRGKLNTEAEKMAKSRAPGRRRDSARAGGSDSSGTPTGSTRKTRTARTRTVAKAAALGGVAAAGALLWSRRTQLSDQIRKLSDQLIGGRQGSEAEDNMAAEDTIRRQIFPVPTESRASSSGRTQVEIAEALSLKELGRTHSE